MNLCVKSFLICCVHWAQLAAASKMLSPAQQRLVSNFLSAKQPFDLPFKNLTKPFLPADKEHESVEAEVARQRAEYTETGQSQRERDLLADMGRLEDQLEGYRRLSPSLHRHFQMQEATAKSLRVLEAKSLRIEGMAAGLWWDSKMLMCAVILFGAGLCIYVHARQSIPQQALISFQSQGMNFSKFSAAAPLDASPLDCEFFSLDEKLGTMLRSQQRIAGGISLVWPVPEPVSVWPVPEPCSIRWDHPCQVSQVSQYQSRLRMKAGHLSW